MRPLPRRCKGLFLPIIITIEFRSNADIIFLTLVRFMYGPELNLDLGPCGENGILRFPAFRIKVQELPPFLY